MTGRSPPCLPGDATPRILASTAVRDQDPWTLDSVKRAGSRVVFLANDRIGLLDGPTIQVVRPPGFDELDDVALATAGPPVFASRGHVLRLDGTVIASLGGAIEPGTLALGDDGRVTWRNADGRAQNVPLAGEPTLACTSGTTLLDTHGLRVFEGVIADVIHLFGCAPGVATPLALWRGGRGGKVFELAREHGLVAVYAADSTRDGVFVFGERLVLHGRPGPSQAYASIRDAALAPDGRVALALRDGRRWRITAFTAAGRERVLARPRDGVTRGSLAIGGTRVTWTNDEFRPLSAPLSRSGLDGTTYMSVGCARSVAFRGGTCEEKWRRDRQSRPYRGRGCRRGRHGHRRHRRAVRECAGHRSPKEKISFQLYNFLVPVFGAFPLGGGTFFPPGGTPNTPEQMQTAVLNVFARWRPTASSRSRTSTARSAGRNAEYRAEVREPRPARGRRSRRGRRRARGTRASQQAQALGLKYVGSGGWPAGTNMDTVEGAENMGPSSTGSARRPARRTCGSTATTTTPSSRTKLQYDTNGDGVKETVPALEVVMLNTDPSLVTFEIDVHWALDGLSYDQDAAVAFCASTPSGSGCCT